MASSWKWKTSLRSRRPPRASGCQIDPDEHAAAGLEPGGFDPIDRRVFPVRVRVDRDQSPAFAWSAACAAARRATGTRYGEQLT